MFRAAAVAGSGTKRHCARCDEEFALGPRQLHALSDLARTPRLARSRAEGRSCGLHRITHEAVHGLSRSAYADPKEPVGNCQTTSSTASDRRGAQPVGDSRRIHHIVDRRLWTVWSPCDQAASRVVRLYGWSISFHDRQVVTQSCADDGDLTTLESPTLCCNHSDHVSQGGLNRSSQRLDRGGCGGPKRPEDRWTAIAVPGRPSAADRQ